MTHINLFSAPFGNLFLFAFWPQVTSSLRMRPKRWATKMVTDRIDNLYQVDQRLYRSAQPTAAGMRAAEGFGIRRVLTLRQFHDDVRECADTSLELGHVQMTADMLDEHVMDALRFILSADSPVLVHCFHGSDRTGLVVAMYRILVQGWSRRQALQEMVYGGFGFRKGQSGAESYLKLTSASDMSAMRRQLVREGLI